VTTPEPVVCQWHLTHHAVVQFQKRVMPDLSLREARDKLAQLANRSRWIETLENGCERWRTPGRRRAILVVNPDILRDGLPMVVTVLDVAPLPVVVPRKPRAVLRGPLRAARVDRRRKIEQQKASDGAA
jgi:hypothetical protein